MRARVAAGLFERIAGASAWCRRLMCTANARGMVSPKLYMVPAEWNGFGRAMYPWACGMHADEGQQTDMATTVALMTQARLSWHAHTGGMLIKAAWSASDSTLLLCFPGRPPGHSAKAVCSTFRAADSR